MAGAVATIERLHRVLARLDDSNDVDIRWYAEVSRLCAEGAPWAAAMGLAAGWRDVLHRHQQDQALRGIFATLPPMKGRAAGREIATRLLAYETTAWPRDRDTGHRPSGAAGFLYDYLGAHGPVGAETLRKRACEIGLLKSAT